MLAWLKCISVLIVGRVDITSERQEVPAVERSRFFAQVLKSVVAQYNASQLITQLLSMKRNAKTQTSNKGTSSMLEGQKASKPMVIFIFLGYLGNSKQPLLSRVLFWWGMDESSHSAAVVDVFWIECAPQQVRRELVSRMSEGLWAEGLLLSIDDDDDDNKRWW